MVGKFLSENPRALESPDPTINLFHRFRIGKTLSWGLTHAFDEFEHAYFRQKRALADHRFWRLITQVGSDVKSQFFSSRSLPSRPPSALL